MNAEQEIRFRALELKMNNITRLASACIQKGIAFNGSGLWTDKDLEEFCDYIRDGKKPEGVVFEEDDQS